MCPDDCISEDRALCECAAVAAQGEGGGSIQGQDGLTLTAPLALAGLGEEGRAERHVEARAESSAGASSRLPYATVMRSLAPIEWHGVASAQGNVEWEGVLIAQKLRLVAAGFSGGGFWAKTWRFFSNDK